MAEITLPQLGETVTEGTITKWFKKVGDSVALDEPLFEVSTDKVDTEVPSPISGVLTEIRVADDGDDGADRNGVPFGYTNLGEYTRNWRRHFGINFVCRHFEKWLVECNTVADFLEPFRNGSFGNCFAKLRKCDLCHVVCVLIVTR